MRLCKARIDSEGWPLTATYTDAAVSGAIRMRPGYQKLLEDARNDAFDIVIAEALDQLSRDQEDVAALYKQSQLRRVTMLTLAEGERSELHVGLKGTMNALFLKDLAKKTWRGLEGRVRQGRSGGGICYGYDVIRELDVHREAVNGGRRINDLAAGVVRRIFAEYAPGARRAPSPRRSTATALPVRAASPGTPRPSMAIGAEAPASSTTSSMSAGWSGIAGATRRIPAGRRGAACPHRRDPIDVGARRHLAGRALWRARCDPGFGAGYKRKSPRRRAEAILVGCGDPQLP